jgi:hypothetical protein
VTWTLTFGRGLLAALVAPGTDVNLNALKLWADSGAVPADWLNPLAATEEIPGALSVGRGGVKAYPSEADAVAATAAQLRRTPFAAIVRALQHGHDGFAIYRAVNASPWGAGLQHGYYPAALRDFLYQGVAAPVDLPPVDYTLTVPGSVAPPVPPSPQVQGAAVRSQWDKFVHILGHDLPAQAARARTLADRLTGVVR